MAAQQPSRTLRSKSTQPAQTSKKSLEKQPPKPQQSPHASHSIPIVGIGASAGGLAALKEFFSHMSPNSGMGFAVVMHLPPDHESLLPTLLARETQMTVLEVTKRITIKPNHVYLSPPGGQLILRGTQFIVQKRKKPLSAVQFPIDSLFRSLAKERKNQAMGIILSGTGTDGTLGMQAIKESMGLTLAQEEASAEFAAMPHSAISKGLIDFIKHIKEMPKTLVKHVKFERQTEENISSSKKVLLPTKPFQKTLSIIHMETGRDFSSYKVSTLQRRINRRMNLNNISRIEQYNQFLQKNLGETTQLSRDLLIGTSTFFRDPQAFQSFQKALLQKLKSKPKNEQVRVWVAGCSTGEEAYTVAMIVHECCEKALRRSSFKVFATDLDPHAIEHARTGLYQKSIILDISPERVDKYFVQRQNQLQIKKQIRDHVIFAEQNLLSDPPFMQLDAVSCRNVFIYLEPSIQNHLLDLFFTSLQLGGVLFLGMAETLGSAHHREQQFLVVDKKLKVYRRQEGKGFLPVIPSPRSSEMNPAIPSHPKHLLTVSKSQSSSFSHTQITNYSRQIEDILLKYHVPPSVLITEQGEMVYVYGKTGEYFELASGRQLTSLNIFEMIRPELKAPLTYALKQIRTKKPIHMLEKISFKSQNRTLVVNIIARKLNHPPLFRNFTLLTLEPVTAKASQHAPKGASAQQDKNTQRDLHRELKIMKASLQTTIEELESANEEMKSTNEEIQSANEELQSTNEELESTKEETQSLNEEMQTVNAELQDKLEDLTRVNDDLTNLINSTNIATLFLDKRMQINRFTPQTSNIFNLLQTDLGRPLSDLTSHLNTNKLLKKAQHVLDTLETQEMEEQVHNGTWYSIRLTPYRTSEDLIDGVVLTFSDITTTKMAQEYAENIVETVTQPLAVINDHFQVLTKNKSFTTHFSLHSLHLKSSNILQIFETHKNPTKHIKKLISSFMKTKNTLEHFDFFYKDQETPAKRWGCTVRSLEQISEKPHRILLAFTEQNPLTTPTR